MKELSLKGEERWRVLFREGKWLVGLYVPENHKREEVTKLERHDYPELFYLVDGRVKLVLESEGKVMEVPLRKDSCWLRSGTTPTEREGFSSSKGRE